MVEKWLSVLIYTCVQIHIYVNYYYNILTLITYL